MIPPMRVAIVGGPGIGKSTLVRRLGEFHDRAGLRHIIETAGLPPFDEVPYRVMDRYDTA
jgi:dephospho-CoA kinase